VRCYSLHIVVYAVFILACYVCVVLAGLDKTPYWVCCIAVLSVCGDYDKLMQVPMVLRIKILI
jgi:hypothetical protein